jgi:hypothetical protein
MMGWEVVNGQVVCSGAPSPHSDPDGTYIASGCPPVGASAGGSGYLCIPRIPHSPSDPACQSGYPYEKNDLLAGLKTLPSHPIARRFRVKIHEDGEWQYLLMCPLRVSGYNVGLGFEVNPHDFLGGPASFPTSAPAINPGGPFCFDVTYHHVLVGNITYRVMKKNN